MKSRLLLLTLICLIIPCIIAEQDSDLDGIPDKDDILPFDYDNDGMPDTWEKKYGLRYDIYDSNDDFDKDGFTNIDEYKKGTNPKVKDDPEKIIETIEVYAHPEIKKVIKYAIYAFFGGLALFAFIKLVLYILHKMDNNTEQHIVQTTYAPRRDIIRKKYSRKYKNRKKITHSILAEKFKTEKENKVVKEDNKIPKEKMIKPKSKKEEEKYVEINLAEAQKKENPFSRLKDISKKYYIKDYTYIEVYRNKKIYIEV